MNWLGWLRVPQEFRDGVLCDFALLERVLQDLLGQELFEALLLNYLLLDGSGGHEPVDLNRALLPDPPRALDRLLVHGWVPVRLEQEDVVRGGQVQAEPSDPRRQQERLRLVRLEAAHELAPGLLRGPPVHSEERDVQRPQDLLQHRQEAQILREYEGLARVRNRRDVNLQLRLLALLQSRLLQQFLRLTLLILKNDWVASNAINNIFFKRKYLLQFCDKVIQFRAIT